jgi:serine/threonine protein kinase
MYGLPRDELDRGQKDGVMGPADLLEGMAINGTWTAVKRLIPKPTDTGGNFSTGYIVQDKSGRKAFLKAMDYTRAFREVDHIQAISALTSAYLFEKNICEKCNNQRLDRVVHAIDSFTIQADPANPFSKVECLIFELANGDIRSHMNAAQNFDLAFTLRALHNVAVALKQLHGVNVAHQDLKPSNVLVFGKDIGSKVADFGRAWSKDFRAAHDNSRIAGDPGYAPPELLYGFVPPDAHIRRYGCDVYLLGSLASYFMTTVHMGALIIKHLDHTHYPYTWSGTYAGVLPYLQTAFGLALEEFRAAVPHDFQRELVEMVSYLCQPDPHKRGHPLNQVGHTNQFGLERFISCFNLLAVRAEMKLTHAGKK